MGKFKFGSKMIAYKAFAFVIVILFSKILYCKGHNYCQSKIQSKLCGRKQHIMCSGSSMPEDVSFEMAVPMTRKVKALFLTEHNALRNKIAGGFFKNDQLAGNNVYPKAARMRTVLWDDELSFLAQHHANECRLQKDECHATPRFMHSGQFVFRGTLQEKISLKALVGKAFEYVYSQRNLVENPALFPHKGGDYYRASSLTELVNENSSTIGCGMAFCKETKKAQRFFIITCNYEQSSEFAGKIYLPGDTASKCRDYGTTPDETYKSLCNNNGRIFL